jgi:superfamily II DNA or RNA helicase
MERVQSLFEAVREACAPASWSRGVELTRADAVIGESAAADEAAFRVTTRGGLFCPRVTLFLNDLEWHCECASRDAACEHVAAAVIAWRRAFEAGEGLPGDDAAAGRVGYRFSEVDGRLALRRVIVHADGEQALGTTLSAVSQGRVAGPAFIATREDLAVEAELGTHRLGPLDPARIPALFAVLERCEDVLFDGHPVRVAAEPLLPRVRVEDDDGGFRVVLEPDPSVRKRFRNGAVLCGDTLMRVGDPCLTAAERRDYAEGRRFGPDRIGELMTDVLPSLRRRLPVDVRTARLPETAAEPPRAVLELQAEGRTLSVLATLVYGDPPVARVDGGRLVHIQGPVPVRDAKAERALLRSISALGLAPGVRAEFDGVEAVAFHARLGTWEGQVRGDSASFELAPPLVPVPRVQGLSFDVAFVSEPAGAAPAGAPGRYRADPASVLRAWRAGESLVPLDGGGWAPLPADWLGRFGSRVAELLAAKQADGELPRCCLPDLARLCEDLDLPPPPDFERLRALAGGSAGLPRIDPPPDVVTALRPYQRDGVSWLAFLRDAGLGAMLADDMGLGKTLQALCAIRPPALVVAPTSVMHNWVDEIRRHRPGLSHCVYHGPGRKLDPRAGVTVTTYTILRMEADLLAGVAWDTVVLDEAQQIKNPDSQVASAACALPARFRVTLTGTPVENRLDELWSQFHFVNRGLLGGRREFQENYAQPIASGDADALRRLRERIRPFLLRRLKREVAAELPPRSETVLHCELADDEREVYDAVRAATLESVVSRIEAGGSVLPALEALLRLRQAACHAALVPGQHVERSSKLELLLAALDTVVADGHKALVFSQWTALLDRTEPLLNAARVPFVRLDGATRDRAEVVRRFQGEDGPPVMLISLKAGGVGLNLTAADHIFLLDPWWNPAVEDQAADRAHRIGQERPVMVYRMVAVDTVEEKILALQQRKRELAEAVLSGTEAAAALTRDDLLDLLR